MTSPLSFEGRVAVVTGAGRGLGRAYCLELAGRGARVVVNDVSGEHADEVVGEIEAVGGAAAASHASVTAQAGARAIVAAALDRFGALDVLINNAGFMRNGYLEELTSQHLDAVLDVHVRGTFLVTQAAWPALRRSGSGRVVVTSSAGGLFAMQGESNYAAAKAGVYGLAKALAFEGREHGVLVNVLLPMAETRIETAQPVPDYDRHYPADVRRALAPHRDVRSVVPFVTYLASRACTVSGEAFSVGFGRFARVFVGETEGWVARDPSTIHAEDMDEHLDEIRNLDRFAVPSDIYDEVRFIADTLGRARAS
jgi:NAD(P)-dependent dehydrogenase (short-subunit alcohol dehydrogenase family)